MRWKKASSARPQPTTCPGPSSSLNSERVEAVARVEDGAVPEAFFKWVGREGRVTGVLEHVGEGEEVVVGAEEGDGALAERELGVEGGVLGVGGHALGGLVGELGVERAAARGN
jgi:hypothetical protein